MNIPILPTQEIGSFRKPKYLIIAWKKFMNREIDEKILKENIIKASRETITLLEKIGLDIVWDGEMHRWEMYHHPISNIKGIEFIGQVRVFDNRYFIKGSVKSKPRLIKNYHVEELKFVLDNAIKPVKIPVTGPYTLADWSFNEYFIKKWRDIEKDPILYRYNAKRELTVEIAKNIINPLLRELDKENVYRIQIDEPAATTHPNEMEIFVESFNEAIKGIETTVTTHICYGDYTRLLPYMNEIKARQYALEFANRDTWNRGVDDDTRKGYQLLKELEEYSYDREIGLGVVDVHTNRIEPVELIMDRIEYALKFIAPEKLFINPDCGLRTRSREIGAKKLSNLIEATRNIRKKYGFQDS